jgi:DNA-binding transcriptional LysR family regulator
MHWTERIGRRLKLKDLHILEAIARLGSMARAAEDLAISQPAISKAMADLEHTLGVALLDRSARGVELTKIGHILLHRGRVVFDEIRQGLSEIEHLSDPTKGEVRLGTVEAMTALVSTIVDQSSRRYPKMSYHVSISDVTTLLRQLRDRELDLVIARWMPTSQERDLAGDILFKDRLVVMAGANHPLANRRRPLSLRALAGENWALPPHESFFGQLVAQAFRGRRLEVPYATFTSISVQMRLNLLESGRFLTVHPISLLRHSGNRDRFKVLPVDLRDRAGPIACISLRKRPATGPVKLFAQLTRAVAKPVAPTEK